MEPTDQQCIQACKGGSAREYRLLIERHQGAVAAHVSAKNQPRAQVEEITQEAFVRAFFSLQRLRKPGSFLSWVIGIADRVAQEQRREERQQPAELPDNVGTSPDQEDAEESDRALRHAISELPEAHREIVLLRFYRGLSCAEIAALQQSPLGSVTKKLSRAYGLLRELLRKREVSEELSAVPAAHRIEVQK